MKALSRFASVFVLLGVWAPPAPADPIQWDSGDPLSLSACDGDVRIALSGLLDIEGYSLPASPPGLIYSDKSYLLNPRLSLFLDGQVGPQIYFFAQSRLDRGFDPSDGGAQVRLDEYAVRFTPWKEGWASFQIGKFATVVGNWTERHLSWDNPFLTAPLPYENLTGIWDSFAARSTGELVTWGQVPTRDNFGIVNGNANSYFNTYNKSQRLPIIWGPSYASGASVAGQLGPIEYAAEIKNSALASQPDSWDITQDGFDHPTVSGRIGYRPNMAWNIGLSASAGSYLLPEAEFSLPPGRSIGDYQEQLLGLDVSYEWHHLQIWSEVYATRFQVPTVTNADTLAYYIEAKYKITPQLFGALRWNQQFFGDVPFCGAEIPWGRDISQVDAAVGYRFTENVQLKLQYTILSERYAASTFEHMIATQLTIKF